MPKKVVPEAILDAAVAMLAPYFSGLTAAELIEALRNRNKPTPSSPTIRKPMTRKQVAELLGVSLATVNRMMRRGVLRSHKISLRAVRISPESVESLLAAPAESGDAN